jgi:hypothetical protein
VRVIGSTEVHAVQALDRSSVVDVTIEVAASTAAVGLGVARRLAAVSAPFVGVALRPPLLAERYHPGGVLDGLARRGHARRARLLLDLGAALDTLVPVVARAVLGRMDLTELVRRYVDLDALVSTVDVDGIVSTVDLDAIAGRLDVDAIVARMDLNAIVRERVDLDDLVATVDIDAIAARIDIEAVIDRIDLVGLAEAVIAEVDLPEIIRESTGTMASETVRGVRMQGVAADQAIGRTMNRFRRHRPSPERPVMPEAPGPPVPRQP